MTCFFHRMILWVKSISIIIETTIYNTGILEIQTYSLRLFAREKKHRDLKLQELQWLNHKTHVRRDFISYLCLQVSEEMRMKMLEGTARFTKSVIKIKLHSVVCTIINSQRMRWIWSDSVYTLRNIYIYICTYKNM